MIILSITMIKKIDKNRKIYSDAGLGSLGGLEIMAIMMISGGQIRAARAYARLSAAELAERAGVARMTVVKAESVDSVPPLTVTNLRSLQEALEKVGVIFGSDGEVNFKPPQKTA